MANKFVTALKENKNNIRKQLLIGVGIFAGSILAGLLVTRLDENEPIQILVLKEASKEEESPEDI